MNDDSTVLALAEPSSTVSITYAQAEITRVVASLIELNRQSEPIFLRMGDEVQAILDKIERTHAEISRALTMMRNERNEGILSNIASLTDKAIQNFNTNAETIVFCQDRLSESMTQLHTLDSQNHKFAENLSRMNAIGIYFAIEIARSLTAQQVFSTFASDIRGLFASIAESITQMSNETNKNVRVQETTIRTAKENHTSLVHDAKHSLQDSTKIIARISDVSTETLDRITKYFSLIETCIGRILVAIQVGDITRQQIEHIITALTPAPPPKMPDGRPNLDWCRLVALQFAQLRHVRTEIIDAQTTFQEAEEQISAVFGILTNDVDELLSGQRTPKGSTDWVAELITELDNINILRKKSETVFKTTLESIDHVHTSLANLEHFILMIGDNNRKLALEAYNARILSMRLGAEGRALTTLAKEVSDLSQATRAHMETVTKAIRSLVAVAVDIGSSIEASRIGQQEEEVAELVNLRQETDEFVRVTSGACCMSRELVKEMAGIRSTLQAVNDIGQKLDQAITALGSIETTLSEATGENLHVNGGANQQHAERYTMEAERRIHQNMTSGHGLDITSVASSLSARQEMVVNEDELGENVDLF